MSGNLGAKRAGASGHGGGLRGSNLSRHSSQLEGCFGRMFRALPAATWTEADLKSLSEAIHLTTDAFTRPN